MFGGEPQHLHVGVGQRAAAVPARLGGGRDVARRVPARDRLPLPLLREPQREPDRRLDRGTGAGCGPCTSAGARQPSPAVDRLGRGSVFETFLNREPCGRGAAKKADGELLVVAAGPSHHVRWSKHSARPRRRRSSSATGSTSATRTGNVYCLRSVDGRTIWTFRAGGPVKGAIAFDRGRVFFGAYDGRLYALRASDGKQIWRAESERATGSAGTARSTRRRPSPTRASTSARPTATSTRSASGAASCAGRTAPAGSSTARRRSGAAGSSSARTTTPSTRSTPRRGHVLWKFHANGPISGSATVVDGIVYFATPQAAHVRARRAHREAGVDVSRRRVHARRDRRRAALRRRLGEGLRIQPANEVAHREVRGHRRGMSQEMIETRPDGKVVPVPRELVSRARRYGSCPGRHIGSPSRPLAPPRPCARVGAREPRTRETCARSVAVLEEEHEAASVPPAPRCSAAAA